MTTSHTFSFTLAFACSLSMQAFRPPAVPLVQVDPFFSIWSAADELTDFETTHWSGAKQPISILLEADGRVWRLCGLAPHNLPALPQKSVSVRPTQTVYAFAQDKLQVELVFSNAKTPEDLDVFSRPVTYVTARVKGAKTWRLQADISPALATNDDRAPMVTNTCTIAGLPARSIGRAEQYPLSESGDRIRCNWGYAWLVGPSAPQAGEAHLMLAYDDVESLQFFNENLPAWWRRNGLSFADMLAAAEADHSRLLGQLDAFDKSFTEDLVRVGGIHYAQIAALAYRQSYAACKLVADRNGQPLYFSKENASNGCMGTVDLIYPQSPHLLLMSPTLMRATLAPILVYAANVRWPWPFAPHDVGQYPLGNRQRYAGGETSKDEASLMPVEESGNMLIALAALSQIEDSVEFVSSWWPTVTKWAQYLEAFGFDPGNQLCTDDFAGHLAHNANLAAKSIVALACYAQMADRRGETDVAAKYRALAKGMVPKWMEAAKGGCAGGYRLAYDQPGTWSMKYNLVWDRVLGLGLFPQEVLDAEMEAYRAVQQPYGLPLDSRKTWTKVDWLVWCATLNGKRADFEAIIDPLYRFLDKTPDRIPFTDWYWADSARFQGFIARSVVGGVFLPVLYDKSLWRKYASRDCGRTGVHASLRTPPKAEDLRVLAPEGRTSEKVLFKYTFNKPPKGWQRPDFDDSSWTTAPGGFGSEGTPGATVRTRWKTKRIWLRRHVKLEMPPKEAYFSIHHDEATTVWVNGVPAGTYSGYTTTYEVRDMSPSGVKALKTGDNVIATETSQTVGGQYVDWGLLAK